MSSKQAIDSIIQNRRAIFPKTFDREKKVPKELIEQVLLNANWAPTHKKTEPWRFTVFAEAGLQKMADWLEKDYKAQNPGDSFSPMKSKKTTEKPLLSSAVIAIVMQRHPDSGLPEWEEIAAVSCAVQNLWLSVSAYGLAGYWSTPGAIERIGSFLDLQENQRCLGFFYLGYPLSGFEPTSTRGNIQDKTTWVLTNN